MFTLYVSSEALLERVYTPDCSGIRRVSGLVSVVTCFTSAHTTLPKPEACHTLTKPEACSRTEQ
jgi:hypothetical protein